VGPGLSDADLDIDGLEWVVDQVAAEPVVEIRSWKSEVGTIFSAWSDYNTSKKSGYARSLLCDRRNSILSSICRRYSICDRDIGDLFFNVRPYISIERLFGNDLLFSLKGFFQVQRAANFLHF
jgi:hypothetical protein